MRGGGKKPINPEIFPKGPSGAGLEFQAHSRGFHVIQAGESLEKLDRSDAQRSGEVGSSQAGIGNVLPGNEGGDERDPIPPAVPGAVYGISGRIPAWKGFSSPGVDFQSHS